MILRLPDLEGRSTVKISLDRGEVESWVSSGDFDWGFRILKESSQYSLTTF